ncbi:hypothetical protein K435DRAFT_796514 [Dendrothele bispora CBS 962.96]|uniref:Uncharacterized protein n=1 Tax=Dendrothele bispora (strain CBS 962.96) TaxID=1314807 RepID=A0A4S8M590_DENBC|nr:hypothetical protein K435DRAFT_796514 [Dendrothele bispora CBS 962.96]
MTSFRFPMTRIIYSHDLIITRFVGFSNDERGNYIYNRLIIFDPPGRPSYFSASGPFLTSGSLYASGLLYTSGYYTPPGYTLPPGLSISDILSISVSSLTIVIYAPFFLGLVSNSSPVPPSSPLAPVVSVPPRSNPSDQSTTPGTDGAGPSEPPTSTVGSSPTDSSTANTCLEFIKGFEDGTRSKVRAWINIQDTINNAFKDNGGRLSNPDFGQTRRRCTKCSTEEPNKSIWETKSSVDQLRKWHRVWRRG